MKISSVIQMAENQLALSTSKRDGLSLFWWYSVLVNLARRSLFGSFDVVLLKGTRLLIVRTKKSLVHAIKVTLNYKTK